MLTTTIVSMVYSDPLTVQLREIAWSIAVNRWEPPGGIPPADPSRDFEASNAEHRAGCLGLLHAYTRMIKVLQRRIDVTVDAALDHGASYGQVAAACGVSRQAARQRWLRHHQPDEPAAALVATGPPEREWDAGTDEAASASPVGGTSASAYLPVNGPHAGIPWVKIRVYELAKEFGVPSKVVMARLQDLGEFVRSAATPVPPELVRQLRAQFSAKQATEINER
jgi:hypothetical protein